jgi:hypothetical protein
VKAREINDEEEGIGEKIKKMGITIILYLLSIRTCRFAKWVKKKNSSSSIGRAVRGAKARKNSFTGEVKPCQTGSKYAT